MQNPFDAKGKLELVINKTNKQILSFYLHDKYVYLEVFNTLRVQL